MQKRCRIFEEISEWVWKEVERHRRTGTEPQETGLTATIISLIRDEYMRDQTVGVWVNEAYNEHIHGGDIDIFIETTPGRFIWYSLQAKALKISEKYESMCHRGDFQWTKLERLSKRSGCIPYFLLYNGKTNYAFNGIDTCSRDFEEKQFGCSIVALSTIKEKSIDTAGNCHPPKFSDFHPNGAEPWRIIGCCLPKWEVRTYTLDQIKVYTEPYRNLANAEPIGFSEAEIYYNFDGTGSNNLYNLTKEMEHIPSHVMLFRNEQLLSYTR